MYRLTLLIAVCFLFSTPALAAPNVGGCGWGSKLMEGKEGPAPQLMAITTNMTSGSQTFGISSGTSGCSQDGVVASNWRTAKFVGANMNKLARDMSVGSGESLESLASLMGVQGKDKALFFQTTKDNFARIFPRAEVTSQEVLASLDKVLLENEVLAQYAS